MIKIVLLLMLLGIGMSPFLTGSRNDQIESALSSSESHFLNLNSRIDSSSLTDVDPPPPYSSLFPKKTSATTVESPPPPYQTDAEITSATTVGAHSSSETGADLLPSYLSLYPKNSVGPAGPESISVPTDLGLEASESTPEPTRLEPAVSESISVPTRLEPAVSESTPVPTRPVSTVLGDSMSKRMRNFFVKYWKYINYVLLVIFFGLSAGVVRNVVHNKHFTSSLHQKSRQLQNSTLVLTPNSTQSTILKNKTVQTTNITETVHNATKLTQTAPEVLAAVSKQSSDTVTIHGNVHIKRTHTSNAQLTVYIVAGTVATLLLITVCILALHMAKLNRQDVCIDMQQYYTGSVMGTSTAMQLNLNTLLNRHKI